MDMDMVAHAWEIQGACIGREGRNEGAKRQLRVSQRKGKEQAPPPRRTGRSERPAAGAAPC